MEPVLFNPYNQFESINIPVVLLRCKGLSSTAKLCWTRLMFYSGKNGFCFPKQITIAEEIGKNKKAVMRALQELEEKQFLYKKLPQGKNRLNHKTAQYYFIYHPIFHPAESTETIPPGVPKSSLPGVPKSSLPGVPKSSLPIENNHNENNHNEKISLKRNHNERAVRRSFRDENNEDLISTPPRVKQIFEYWEEKGLKRISRSGTNAYNNAVLLVKKLLRGKLFIKRTGDDLIDRYVKMPFSVDEIKTAIDGFALAALDLRYEPSKLERKNYLSNLNIQKFIINYSGGSVFLQYIDKKPKLLMDSVIPVEDKHPEITRKFMNYYLRKVLGGVRGNTLTETDKNHFVRGANKLVEFYKEIEKRLAFPLENGVHSLASTMCKCLMEVVGVEKLSPGYFSSDRTFDRRLPAYMNSQQMLMEEEKFKSGTGRKFRGVGYIQKEGEE